MVFQSVEVASYFAITTSGPKLCLAEWSEPVPRYSLCWCENDTVGACESLSDFNVSAGLLTLRGPTKQDTRTAHSEHARMHVCVDGIGVLG